MASIPHTDRHSVLILPPTKTKIDPPLLVPTPRRRRDRSLMDGRPPLCPDLRVLAPRRGCTQIPICACLPTPTAVPRSQSARVRPRPPPHSDPNLPEPCESLSRPRRVRRTHFLIHTEHQPTFTVARYSVLDQPTPWWFRFLNILTISRPNARLPNDAREKNVERNAHRE